MAGPTFRFAYLADRAPTLDQVARAIAGRGVAQRRDGDELHIHVTRTIGKRTAESGSIFLGLRPGRDFSELTAAQRAAVGAALGGIPDVELAGYAMANGEVDREGLRGLAVAIANQLGGFWPSESWYDGAIEVAAQDLEAFFGAMAHDRAYVEANRHLVPVWRRWLLPAALVGGRAVAK